MERPRPLIRPALQPSGQGEALHLSVCTLSEQVSHEIDVSEARSPQQSDALIKGCKRVGAFHHLMRCAPTERPFVHRVEPDPLAEIHALVDLSAEMRQMIEADLRSAGPVGDHLPVNLCIASLEKVGVEADVPVVKGCAHRSVERT